MDKTFFHATVLTSIFIGTPTFDLNGAIFLGLFVENIKGRTEHHLYAVISFNYMTFVENVFNSYQGSPFPNVYLS